MALFRIVGIDMRATGARIRYLRILNHLRVEDLCNLLYVSEQAVYKWQRGSALPSLDNLYALSQIFNTPMDQIVVSTENATNSKREDGAAPSSPFFMFPGTYTHGILIKRPAACML